MHEERDRRAETVAMVEQLKAERDALQREVERAMGLLDRWKASSDHSGCSYKRPCESLLCGDTRAFLAAPEPQKAKEDEDGYESGGPQGWVPAPPPPEEPGRHAYVFRDPGKMNEQECKVCGEPLRAASHSVPWLPQHKFMGERLGGVCGFGARVGVCGKPASDPVHTPAPQRLPALAPKEEK